MRQAQQPAIPVNRMGNAARPLTAMQESQLFDQTMQGIHVRQGQLSPVLPGVIMQDSTADARVQAIERQRAQMLRQFQRPAPFVQPQGPTYNVLSGDKAGTPKPLDIPRVTASGGTASMVGNQFDPTPIPSDLSYLDASRNGSQYYGTGDQTERDRLIAMAQSAFPQMTRTELAGRTTEQLRAMVQLGDQQKAAALSGNKTGQPQVPYAPYGYAGTGSNQEISHTSADVLKGWSAAPARVPDLTPEQEAQLFDLQMKRIELERERGDRSPYELAVADARLEEQQKRLLSSFQDPEKVQPLLQNQIGSPLDLPAKPEAGSLADRFGEAGHIVGTIGSTFLPGPANAYHQVQRIKDSTHSPEFQQWLQTPEGKVVGKIMEGLNKGYEWNTENSAGVWYAVAIGEKPGYADNPLGNFMDALPGTEYIALAPDIFYANAIYAIAPDTRQGVIDAHDNGYSSPSYIAAMEAAGITDYPPQFTGDQAVHEYLIGRSDSWPAPIRDALRLGENIVMDPLTYLPIVGQVSKGVKEVGKALAVADDASFATKVAGRGAQVAGAIGEYGAKLPDTPFELAGWGWNHNPFGTKTPGAFQLSADQVARDAETAGVHHGTTVAQAANNGMGPHNPFAGPAAPTGGITPGSTVPPGGAPTGAATAAIPSMPGAAPGSTVPPGGAPTGTGGRVVTGFTTSKGSTYEVTPNGTTIRNKTPHAGHDPNDVGLKPESSQTLYFDDPNEIGIYRTSSAGWFNTPNGQFWTGLHVSNEPQVGWYPYEVWPDGSYHVGNQIVSVNYGNGPSTGTVAPGSTVPPGGAPVPAPKTVAEAQTKTGKANIVVVDTDTMDTLYLDELNGDVFSDIRKSNPNLTPTRVNNPTLGRGAGRDQYQDTYDLVELDAKGNVIKTVKKGATVDEMIAWVNGGDAAPSSTVPTGDVGAMTYAPPSATGTPLVRIPPAPADAPPVLWHTSTNSAGATTHTAYIGDTGNVRVIQRGQTVITQQINPDTGEWATTGSQTVSTRGAAPLHAAQELDQAFSDAIHEARISYVAPVASSEPPTGPPPNKPKIDEPDDEAPVTTSTNNGNPPVIRHQTPPRPGADETRIESLVPPVSPEKIPGDFPEVKTAVERGLAGTKVDTTGNIPGESAFTPVYGGSGPQDVAVTRAVASGDLRAISDANELAQQIAPLADTLNSAPEYRGFHAPMTRGGVTVNGTVLIEGMSPDQIRALRQMQSSTGGTVAAPYRMANLTKEVLEKAAELKFLGDTYAPLHREIMGYPLVNTEADQMFGFTWTPMNPETLKPLSGVQRVQYLMERFVTTSSEGHAQMLRDWLSGKTGPTGPNVLNITDGPKPYLMNIPDPYRQQVMDMLEEARAAYRKNAAELTPEEAAAWEARKAPGIKPTSATQMEGGLKGSTKKAAKQYNDWVKANEPKRAAPDTSLGIKFDPMGDAEAKVNSALDQAQRPADDMAYRDANGDPPKNPMLQQLSEIAAPGFDNKATEYLNTTITWKPKQLAKDTWYPEEWTVFDAMLWAYQEKVRNPAFDYWGALDEIGYAQAGLPPKMTAAEKKAAIKVYKDRGEVVPEYLTKSDRVQRLESTRAIRLYDKYLNQVRQASLFGPIGGFAGYVGDVIGNFWAQIVNGHFGPAFEGINPIKNIGSVKGFRETQRAVESVNPFMAQNAADAYVTFQRNAHQAADAMLEPILRETGQLMPQDLYPSGTVREVKVSGKPSLNAAVEGRNPVIRGAANLWTVPGIKDLRTSTDLLNRTSLFKSVYKDSIYRDALPAFRKKLGEKVGKANVDAVIKDTLKAAEARAQSANVKWNGMFSPEDVKTALNGKPYADDMARAWQGETNLSVAKAYNEQKRVFFSYKNTNADELVGSVMMFHYWQTRASYMHLRAALRHPVLLNGYYKLWQELKDRNAGSGVGYLGPMYKFLTSPAGVYVAVDILALAIPMTIADMADQEGNKLRGLQNQLNPVLGSILAIAGVTDNVPNVTGFRTTERWLINMGNFLVAEGVDVSSVPILNKVWDNNTMRLNMPIDEAVKTILQDINGWAESKGIPVGDFKPFDRGANEMDQLNTWVIKGVEQRYGPQETWEPDGPAWQALDDALDALTTGASNPIADEAEKNYAQEGFIAAMAAPVVPGGVITRSEYRDEQIAGNKTGDQGASDNRDIATSADPTWTTMHQQYNKIGTPEEQAVYDQWIALTYGDMNTPVTAHTSGGLVVIPKSYIQNMSDEEREDFTNRWVAQNPGYSETIQKIQSARDAFKLAHPQMSEFKEYQKAAYNEDTGGVRAFRTSLAKTNPNFANELKKQREMLEGFGYKGEELERRLDGWAAGKDGYLAAMGLPIKNGDKPLPVYDPSKNPYENPAMAGMAPQPGGGSSGTGEGSKSITKGPDGKLYDKDGNLVNASGKRINEQGQVIDSYWYPDEVAQRYAQQQAKYDDANKQMESQFGPYWNDQTGTWEASADTSAERKKLSYNGRALSDIPYNKPEKGQLMQDYEAWADVNGGGSLEDWFNYLMSTPGYGVQADPATTIGYGAKPATPSAPTRATSIGGALEQRLNAAGMSLSAPPAKPAKSSGQVTGTNVSSIDGYQISQQYGMTDFAAGQIGPGGMYDYTSDYTTDGSAVGHMGIDVALPDHTELYAPVSGTVVQAGGMPFEMDDRYQQAPGTGGLRIQLDNGDIVVMAHMQQIDVNVGDRVELGQPVGYSGIANGGAHVHVEYRQYAPGQTASGYLAVNPLTMLDMTAVQ